MRSLVTCRSVGFNGTGGSDYRLGPVGEFLLHLITQDSRFVVNEAVVTPIDEGGYPEQSKRVLGGGTGPAGTNPTDSVSL